MSKVLWFWVLPPHLGIYSTTAWPSPSRDHSTSRCTPSFAGRSRFVCSSFIRHCRMSPWFLSKKVHRHCGAKPSDPIAQQVTLWASILSSYRSFWQSLWKKAGDFKINFRIHRFGRKGCNQWSDDASKKANQGESRFEGATGESKSMFQRIADIPASRKKPRRICGYSNLSQRQFRFDLFWFLLNPLVVLWSWQQDRLDSGYTMLYNNDQW